MNSAQAQHALIDPLIEPEPSEQTGLNSHFTSTYAPRQTVTPPQSAGHKSRPSGDIRPQQTGSSIETNPYRRARAESSAKTSSDASYGEITPNRRNDYPSPPHSASPRREHVSNSHRRNDSSIDHRAKVSNHRAEAFGAMNQDQRRPMEYGRPRGHSQPQAYNAQPQSGGLNRSGSLRQRYPGDTSNRPLDILRNDTKTAHRAHHLRKKNQQNADIIDCLDQSTFKYHHEGPYDAVNFQRNKDSIHSPIAAVQASNEEALRATPHENIVDALTKHRPLEGVAMVPSGLPDQMGRVLDYEEGTDLQREGKGNYGRWSGQEYAADDLKGKGKHDDFNGERGIEMTTRRHRHKSLGTNDAHTHVNSPFDDDNRVDVDGDGDDGKGVGRSNTTGRSMRGALKKRFGSLRRKKVDANA